MKTTTPKTIDSVSHFPDRTVACPICRQEFWGFSEIIFCSCGWTYIKEDESPRMQLRLLRQSEISGRFSRLNATPATPRSERN